MGRVSRQQAEENRKRIVETACRLFRQHGAESVSIADIMGAAGLTQGGFYKHFASKEALLEEAFSLAFEQSAQAWEGVCKAQPAGTASAQAALVKHYFTRRPAEKNCPLLSLASEVSHSPAESRMRQVYGQGADALFQQFRSETLKALPARPNPASSEADDMLLFAAMVGTGLLTQAIGETEWVRELQAAVLGALPSRLESMRGVFA